MFKKTEKKGFGKKTKKETFSPEVKSLAFSIKAKNKIEKSFNSLEGRAKKVAEKNLEKMNEIIEKASPEEIEKAKRFLEEKQSTKESLREGNLKYTKMMIRRIDGRIESVEENENYSKEEKEKTLKKLEEVRGKLISSLERSKEEKLKEKNNG